MTAVAPHAGTPVIHHDISITLNPEDGSFTATDLLSSSEDLPETLDFLLHEGLEPVVDPGAGTLKTPFSFGDLPNHVKRYRVRRTPASRTIGVRYGGRIVHPFENVGPETARGMKQTAGTISRGGVYLTGSSYWYPHVPGRLVTASIRVRLPEGWISVSQGPSPEQFQQEQVWRISAPQDELFLMAYTFHVYRKKAGRISAEVYLRAPDDSLAERYLEATADYLQMYEGLIGPYPYSKFALVENFWETGYGMPSFTLLGPRVIRMPFILYSSYPHEILHNWWGNGVYPDWESGNWSEGLTAYLSDHLIKEQQGQAPDYRQTTLQKYADYVRSGRDFPLSAFTSRHSSSSEAIGYGKSLMLFHMLRRELGDDVFVKALQHFYREFRFRTASYGDLRKSFEFESGRDLNPFFQQWTTRTGAPMLRIADWEVKEEANGYRLRIRVLQTQEAEAYMVNVPVWISLKGEAEAREYRLSFSDREAKLDLLLEKPPVYMELDPEYDVFRQLHREEVPPAISQVLGAEKMLIVMPRDESPKRLDAYRIIAEGLRNSGPEEIRIITATESDRIPDEGSVVILGYGNRWLGAFRETLSAYPFSYDEVGMRIEGTRTAWKDHTLVVASRTTGREGQGLLWIVLDNPSAAPGLTRKLPHYHKYSYLGFEGEVPENVLKGRWPVIRSPMSVFLDGSDGRPAEFVPGEREPQKALVERPARFSADRMLATVRYLSSAEMGGRGYEGEGLALSAEYIRQRLMEAGLEAAGSEGYYQAWTAALESRTDDIPDQAVLRNVIGRMPGTNPKYDGEVVVIGAHYDHLGAGWPDVRAGESGKHHPGADDNASGVAVLLELADAMKNFKPERTILFIAFTGEELGRVGSRYYLSSSLAPPRGKCVAMINLDTVGRLGKGKLLVLGGGSAREWVHIFRGVGYVTGVDIRMVAEPLDSSDQTSFHEAGIPAIQFFSGPHTDYHTPRDEPERLDGEGLVRVAAVARETLIYLSGRDSHLENMLVTGGAEAPPRGPEGGRRVSLGTIPDFTFTEKGCRLSGVVPGSPAEGCGLTEGDVIVRINGETVDDLRSMSRVLKGLNPGDRVTITYIRDGREATTDAEVTER